MYTEDVRANVGINWKCMLRKVAGGFLFNQIIEN
jgi:hypothetical protein